MRGGENVLPSNAGAFADESHRLGGHVDHEVARILPDGVVGDVGEISLGREGQEEVIAIDLECIGGGHCLDGQAEVGYFTSGVERGGAVVDIHRAVLARVEGVAIVVGELERIVVEAGASLVVGLSSPPVGRIAYTFTTSEVTLRLVVDVPGSLAEQGGVLGEVHNGVVDVEGACDLAIADAIATANLDIYGVVARRGEDALIAVDCAALDLLAGVDVPDGIDTLGILEVEGHLVGGLIDGDFNHVLEVGCLRHPALVEALDVVGRTCNQRTCYQKGTQYIFICRFHNG